MFYCGRVCITILVAFWVLRAEYSDTTGVGDEPVIDIVVEDSALSALVSPDADSLPPLEKMPELTHFVDARYSPALIKKGVEGTVGLELIVNEKGLVDSAYVVAGLEPELDSSAVAAARAFVFSPAMAGGVPVAVQLQYNYRFSLRVVADSIMPYVNFSGRLLERGEKKPIADAVVAVSFTDSTGMEQLPIPRARYLEKIGTFPGQELDNNTIVVTSDSAGFFQFYALAPSGITVTVIAPGCAEFKTDERIVSGEELRANYYIERVSSTDYEVVVYGKTEEKEVSRHQLTINEVKKIPGLGGDAIKVIQAMPGVASTPLGSGAVIVRGAPTWDTKFYLDGVELPQLYHFGGLKSVYNSEALASIDFYPGGFGTKYGDAIAGVVEIKGRKGSQQRVKASGELSTVDGSVFVEGPITKNISVIASARRSFIGDIASWLIEQMPDQFPFTVTPFYWDYLMRTDATIAKNNELSLTLFGSKDSLGFFFPRSRFGSDEVSDQTSSLGTSTVFHMGILTWKWDLSERWQNTCTYNLTTRKDDFSAFGFAHTKQDVWANHIRDQLSYRLSEKLQVQAGADIQALTVDHLLVTPNGEGAISRDTIAGWQFGDYSAYLNAVWKPVDRLQIIPGIRYDYYPELLYYGSVVPELWAYESFNNSRGFSGEPSLRCNGRFELVKNHVVKAAIGTYNQSPEPRGQVIHKTWGDPMMPATKAAHYVGGYEWQLTNLVNLDAQLYYNKQWNIPEPVTASDLTATGEFQKLYMSSGLGRMYGFELMLRHQQGPHFFGWLAYTLARTERWDRHAHEWYRYDSDQLHNLQLLGSWKLPRHWDAGFRLRYVTGNPATPINSVEEVENYNGYYIANMGKKNSVREDPLLQLDLRIDKKVVFEQWMLSFFIDFQNISWFLYKSPQYGPIYSFDYQERQMFSAFPLVAVGIKAEY